MVRIVLFALLLAGMSAYITFSAHRLFELGRLSKTPAVLSWILSALPAAAGLALIPITGDAPASIIALGHLTAILILWDVILWFVSGKRVDNTKIKAVMFVLSFVVCAGYITFGAVNAFCVTPAFYSVTTDKQADCGTLRMAQISDCHLGTTFDGEGFARHIETINAQQPDVLVITGDFADSRTTFEEMAAACAALEKVNAPLGVFYVPGNHEGGMAEYKSDMLYGLLKQHGVTVLDDGETWLTDGVVLCGRKDADERSRRTVGEWMDSIDSADYTVFLDHQPREYDDYAAHGADLVLSGHTHAGQMFPLGMFIEVIGMGENTYGMEQRGDTVFIVSSGLSGLIPLRTEANSEFVIIDIVFAEN